MFESEIDEIIADVSESIQELGTLDNVPNLVWKRRIFGTPDRTYLHEADYTPKFEDYVMYGLALGQMTKQEMEEIGIDDDAIFKYYITGDQFTKYWTDTLEFRPENKDRLLHRGVVYEVIKRKPIMVSEKEVIYLVYGKQAYIAAQSEEYRENVDPYFEYDASQEETSANDTGSNSNLYIDLPVKIIGAHELPTSVWTIDNKFEYSIDGGDKILYEVPAGTYTVETFAEAFKPEGLNVVIDESAISIESITLGKDARVDIYFNSDSIYEILGISPGIYKGSEEQRL